MQTERNINATLTNEELQQADKGQQVDKSAIVEQISKMPQKERMDLIRDLQTAANYDADWFSTGQPGSNTHYDTLRDRYHKEARDANKKQEEQPAETK